ncbi:MAG: hypothetical protein CMF58_03110 [Lentimicrobiaceae bacterium]|jgi:hypothetical protein|nr:hypothetical protein [Lentimicrobiaceae bacterium]MDG1901553.1 DUF481 domain-containing protein [Bacteroidales bacterium]MDG2081602.1 DUF481 domain-containing protein [Bacteroidales bacterium]|tara:strand:+ start:1049 stop:2098 length:1050 start_codon:yes stop_codon:yes gene_type:complete
MNKIINKGSFGKILLVMVIFVTSMNIFGQKTDTIVHINGNILLGEIKKLNDGIITYKMDGMGTIKFQVDKINTFKSEKSFQVVLKDGKQYFGSFDTCGIDRYVNLILINGSERLFIEDIIELYPIKKNFWLRTSGSLGLGFNYSKGSDIATLTTSGSLYHRNRHTYAELSWSDNTTYQSDSINSNKSDANLMMQRLIYHKWYLGGNLEGSSNSELGYKFRILGGVSIINYIVQNYHNRLYLSLGSNANREWSMDTDEVTNNLEGLFGINYHYYKYTDPEFNITTYLKTYPNFTTPGRYRVNYYLDAKIEVISDFNVGINFYYNFDSKPISEDASREDYGIATTISYTFH